MENRAFEITDDLLASNGKRFVHYILDVVVLYAIVFALMFLLAIVAGVTGMEGVLDWLRNITDLQGYFVFFVIWSLYYGLLETFFSRTVAKFVTKTIVVMKDGSKPDGTTILKRTLCRLIPFDGLSFFGSNGWHDSISDTYVVNKEAFDLKKEQFYAFDEIGAQTE